MVHSRVAFCVAMLLGVLPGTADLHGQSPPETIPDPPSLSGAADEALEQGRFQEALRLYSLVLKKDPTSSEAFLGRGMAYDMLDRGTKAIEDYRNALQEDPKNYVVMESLAGLYERSGQHLGKAVQLYKRALELDPRPEWRENLRVCIAMLRSRLRPVESYAVGLWHKGNKADRKNDPDRAKKLYAQALSRNPRMFQAHFSRALARIHNREAALAVEDLDATLRLSPLFPRALVHRGTTYEALGKYDEAHEDFQQAVQNDPKDPVGYYYFGKSLHRRGQLDEAVAAYRTALTLKPKPDLRELLTQGMAALPLTVTRKKVPPTPQMDLW